MDEATGPSMRFKTKAIHIGFKPDTQTGALMPPIYMTSTYIQEAPGVNKGYEYTRSGNPNFTMLENLLASLEEGKYATIFSSGLGALTALISMLKPGDKVIAINGLYGGTYRLFKRIFEQYGIIFETYSKDQIKSALTTKPKWLLFETPTNPLIDIYDIENLCLLARENGVTSIVDNTFATPFFQNPLSLGADIVWHSTTKYISGHSDVIGGVMITNDQTIKEELDFRRMSIGVSPSPFDAWLTMRGVKTLALRMQQHEQNAFAIVDFLSSHPLVEKIYFPGIETHPGHLLAKKQMRGFSGMVSVEFKLSLDDTISLIQSFDHFTLAESLGGVESLVNQPATMTHASIPKNKREGMGITDNLIRFSCGIEDPEDLVLDISTKLDRLSSAINRR